MGSDGLVAKMSFATKEFLSTLPAWGATIQDAMTGPVADISIHAPRVGSDAFAIYAGTLNAKFLSTLPAWGATRGWDGCHWDAPISIHAPRVGSDPLPIDFILAYF